MAQDGVMSNQAIQAMIAGGVPVSEIVRSILTAARIDLHFTDPADRARLVEAGATGTDADAILKAIAHREYVGRDVPPEPAGAPAAAIPQPPAPVAAASPNVSSSGVTNSSPLRSFTKSATARQRIKTSIADFAVWVDETKWKPLESDSPRRLTFANVNGTAWATVVSEPLAAPTGTVRDLAVTSAQKTDPDTRVSLEEKRIVNGREILALQMSRTIKGIPFTFLGYYHGGTSGAIQVVAYTLSGEFERNFKGLTDFLNGLEISDKDIPPVSTQSELALNSRISIKYDQKKWKRRQVTEPGRFSFTHSSGDGYALVTFERWPIPADSLPELALKRVRITDPGATIVFREKRKVGGVDVWFLKIDAVVDNIPLAYYGYFYGDKYGSVQVLTYTARTLVSEYDPEFMAFLNGLVVTP